MYFKQSIQLKEFIAQLKSGQALPTGSASPYRLNDEVSKMLESGPQEGELIGIGTTINGGQWKGDSGQGYIGNFQCRVRFGAHETFANLSVADVLTALGNGGKTTFRLEKSPNVRKPEQPYLNVRAEKPIVVDVKDTKTISLLDSIEAFATTKPLQAVGG